MEPLIIGSRAAKLWFPDFPREPKDIDYFAQEKQKDNGPLRAETFWHPNLANYNWQNGRYATPDELYTIKVSHLFWNNNWVKHAKDAIFFQEKGCELIPELYDILVEIWTAHYGRKKARLAKGTKPEEFFTASVERVYEHDSIHASVAYYDKPLFSVILADGEAVAVDWNKFEQLTHTDKLRLVREEIYATALERKIIPSGYQHNSLQAYRWALQQTITSYWKGKWALFAVLNLKDLVVPEIDYVKVHLDNSERLVAL